MGKFILNAIRRKFKRNSSPAGPSLEALEMRLLMSTSPLITEFMALNNQTLEDEDGNSSDWIEIYNPGNTPLDLEGYRLTDDPDNIGKWTFPSVMINPGEYLIVFASGEDRTDPLSELHTNFGLSGNGEYLALIDPAETVLQSFNPFPDQKNDISYGSQMNAIDETLLEPGDSTRVFIPTDNSLGQSWVNPIFDDSGWLTGQTGVGYQVQSAVDPQDPIVDHVDLTSFFNGDTIGTSTTDASGAGYRSFNEKFLQQNIFPADGLLEVGNESFQFASYNSDNTILMGLNASQNLDITDGAYSTLSFAHSAVGFNTIQGQQNTTNGTVTVSYTDGSQEQFTWDVADNDGNNGQDESSPALTGLTLHRYSNGAQFPGRMLWYQTIGVDSEKTVDEVTFSTVGVVDGGGTDAVFGIYALTGSDQSDGGGDPGADTYESFPIILPGNTFNSDTLAVDSNDSVGAGYRLANEKFLTTPFPSDGLLQVPDGPTFQLEPYISENTILMNLNQTYEVDIPDGQYDLLSVLHSAVGFNSSATNGSLVVHYTDGSSESLEWDVADNDGNNSSGLSTDALTGLTLYKFSTEDSFSGRQLWYQNFEVNASKTVDRLEFSTVGVVDGGGTDAEFGVYAVTGLRTPSYDDAIQFDVENDMFENTSSAYLRIPFEVTDPAIYNSLLLEMNYDDGFVAYLNGIEVARRNALEGIPGYDAVATLEREGSVALQPEIINISGALSNLQTGTNVLAIHGLNINAGDEDFLISPRLTASTVTIDSELKYFDQPTPGSLNAEGFDGFVADTQFSVDRGFYDAAFDLEITSDTAAAAIYYTLDGSTPSPENGTLYETSITIDGTRTVRAMAVKDGFRPTNVDTQTYISIADVLSQPASIPGYPQPQMQSRGGGTPLVTLDFEMDPFIVNDSDFHDDLIEGLTAIPSISLVTDPDKLFGLMGIYDKGGSSMNGVYETDVSVEIIDPANPQDNTQANAALRPQSHQLVKRSLQLLFKDEYGPTRFDTDLFRNFLYGENASDSIDRIVLRAGHNRSFVHYWNPDDSSYTRDEWQRVTREAMSGVGSAAHGTFAHLYINGIYWGLYNPVERPDEAFSEDYFGGNDEDWYARNHGDFGTGGESLNGDSTRFDYLTGPLENMDLTDPANYDTFQEYLDVEKFADYLLLNFYGGNADWPHNNFYGGNRNGDDPTPFIYYDWDAEGILDGRDASGPFNQPGGRGNPGSWVHPQFRSGANPTEDISELWHAAITNVDFLMMFVDRAYAHTHHDGALSDEQAQERWLTLNTLIENAIIGESARWGDVRESFDGVVRTRDTWQNDVNNVYDMLSGNGQRLIDALRAEGFYPDINPPAFNINGVEQHGGEVNIGDALTFTQDQNVLTYQNILGDGTLGNTIAVNDGTLDNTDGTPPTWTTVGYDDSTWPIQDSPAGFGYERNTGNENDFMTDVESLMFEQSTSLYARLPFTLTAQDLNAEGMQLSMKYDDGFIAYLNGVEIARSDNVTDPTPGFDTTATSHEADGFETFDLTQFIDLLQEGENVLSIHGINLGLDSSDFIMRPELSLGTSDPQQLPTIYYTTDGTDPRLSGGGINPNATLYSGQFPLNISATINARAISDQSDWSALNTALFSVDTPLRVSEIQYNPDGPDDAEFIELANTGNSTVDLTGISFIQDPVSGDGIIYTFLDTDALNSIAPGERIVIVKDLDAFSITHPEVPAELIADRPFEGSLNNAGEVLTLLDKSGGIIQQFAYSDDAPWDKRPDGAGPSLDLIDTTGEKASWGLAGSWRASGMDGGTPGRLDPVDGAIEGDANYDGFVNLEDLAKLATNFGRNSQTDPLKDVRWLHGDFTGDGTVDLADLAKLATNFGTEGSNGFPVGIAAADGVDLLNVAENADTATGVLLVNTDARIETVKAYQWNHIANLLSPDDDIGLI